MRSVVPVVFISALLLSACGGEEPAVMESGEVAAIKAEEEQALEVPADPCPVLNPGTPVGLACIHCMQPEAHAQAQALAEILYESCQQNITMNYLADGSFSISPELVQSHIDYLMRNNRKFFINFYMINGASQRNWDSTPHRGFAVTIQPEAFRSLLKNDPAFQHAYQEHVRSYLPLWTYAKEKGAVVTVVPVLEDNLTDEDFVRIAQLTVDAIPPALGVAVGRNPMPGAYKGNSSGVPLGYFREEHTSEPAVIGGGITTNDGIDYENFVPAKKNQKKTTLAALARTRDAARQADCSFILWSAKRQGFAHRTKPASQRSYPLPDSAEKQELLAFLRGEG